MKRKIAIFGLVLLPIFIGLVAIYFGLNKFQNSSSLPRINQPKIQENNSQIVPYKDITYGFSFDYAKSWKYLVLQENLDGYGKILFLPQKTSVEMYNQVLSKNDDSFNNVVTTIAPVKIEISRILSNNVDIVQLVKDSCGQQTLCDVDLAKDIKVAGEIAKELDLKSPFDGKAIFFIKTYSGTAPIGRYLYKISMRSDKQTQNLFNIDEIKEVFKKMVATFVFNY